MIVRATLIVLGLVFIFSAPTLAVAECKKHIELHSAKYLAKEFGKTEAWVLRNHKINVWAKTSNDGKFPKVGEMRPGSRAVILDKKGDDYKVLSPLDSSKGWVSEIQVSRTLMQDTKTREPCG